MNNNANNGDNKIDIGNLENHNENENENANEYKIENVNAIDGFTDDNKKQHLLSSIEHGSGDGVVENANGEKNAKLQRKRKFVSDEEGQSKNLTDDNDAENYVPVAKCRDIERKRKFSLNDFSDEMLFEIVKHLDTWSLITIMNCSTRFHYLVLDHRLWTHIDLSKVPLPLGMLEDVLERTNRNTKVIRIHGPPISEHLESETNHISQTMAETFAKRCKNLVELELKGISIDIRYVRIADFPKHLRRLRLINCGVPNPIDKKGIFAGIDNHLTELEEIALEYNDWFEPFFILMLSKVPKLRILSLKGCSFLSNFVPYGSMAARFGFKALEILDVRYTPINDSDLQCFNAVRTLKQLLLERPNEEAYALPNWTKCKPSAASLRTECWPKSSTSAASSSSPSSASANTQTISLSVDVAAKSSPNKDSNLCANESKRLSFSSPSSPSSALPATASSAALDKGKNSVNHENEKPAVIKIDADGPSTSAAARLRVCVSVEMSRLQDGLGSKPPAANASPNGVQATCNEKQQQSSDDQQQEQQQQQKQPQQQQEQDKPRNPPFSPESYSSSSSSSSSSDGHPPAPRKYSANARARNIFMTCSFQNSSNANANANANVNVNANANANANENANDNAAEPLREVSADEIILLDVHNRRGQHSIPRIRTRQFINFHRNNNHHYNNHNNNNNNNHNNGLEQVVNHPMFWNMFNPIGNARILVEEPASSPESAGIGDMHNQCIGRRLRVARGPCISIVRNDYASYFRRPITDRGVCGFGRPRYPVNSQIIWISIANRPSENSLERLIVRNYEGVTNISLEHLVQCSPNLVYLDLSFTGVTKSGVDRFRQLKPNCRVVADHLVRSGATVVRNYDDYEFDLTENAIDNQNASEDDHQNANEDDNDDDSDSESESDEDNAKDNDNGGDDKTESTRPKSEDSDTDYDEVGGSLFN